MKPKRQRKLLLRPKHLLRPKNLHKSYESQARGHENKSSQSHQPENDVYSDFLVSENDIESINDGKKKRDLFLVTIITHAE